jgi:hypothetical protein
MTHTHSITAWAGGGPAGPAGADARDLERLP